MTTPMTTTSPGAILATEEKRDRFANGHLIWQTILELRNTERRINRTALAALTGLKPGIVDDHVERWIEKDQLRRAGAGELEVVEHFPATRPISKTTLPNGLVKLEIGSDLLELTPTEARTLARDLAGHAQELAQVDAANKAMIVAHEQARELKLVRKEVKRLQELLQEQGSTGAPRQLDLLAALH